MSVPDVAETARRHFDGLKDLVLVAVDAERLDVRWEPSRGGALFPHLYGVLPKSAVKDVRPFTVPSDAGASTSEPQGS